MRNVMRAVLAAVACVPAARAATLTTLSYPGAANTCALGVASDGRVAGDWSSPSRPNAYVHNFIATNGRFANVTLHYQGLLGLLYGLNHGSVAVGGLFTPSGANARAFTYANGSIALVRPPANSPYSIAMGINDAGTIVGTTAQGNRLVGFSLSGGKFTTFSFPGSTFTRATGVGPTGTIVGIAGIVQNGAPRVIGWTWSGGAFTPVSVPGAANTFAASVDQAGRVYGFTYVAGAGGSYRDQHGFILSGGRYTGFDVPGAQQTFIQGATPAGVFVGCSETGTAWRGFVATP